MLCDFFALIFCCKLLSPALTTASLQPSKRASLEELIESLTACTQSLLHIANDVLDISKLEAEQLTLHSAPLDLCALGIELKRLVLYPFLLSLCLSTNLSLCLFLSLMHKSTNIYLYIYIHIIYFNISKKLFIHVVSFSSLFSVCDGMVCAVLCCVVRCYVVSHYRPSLQH